jgi:CheY-specific phosphatase CheX
MEARQITELQRNVLAPFVKETVRSLQEMARLPGRADEGFQDDLGSFRFKGYAVCAKLHGKVEGVVLLHLYPENVQEIGRRILRRILEVESETTEIDEAAQDALAEWGNTALGHATRALEKADLGVRFESPFFVSDTQRMDALMQGVTEVASVPIHYEADGKPHRFYFNLLLR